MRVELIIMISKINNREYKKVLISILKKAKIRHFGISLAATFSLIISLFASVAYSENLVARMSGHWSPKHQSAIHSQIFADEVTKRSNGRLTIEFYPSKQLFGIREVMGAITSGAVELGGVVGVVSFPPINKNFNVASYPGLFSSYEQQRSCKP